jgi:hypothetical protein
MARIEDVIKNFRTMSGEPLPFLYGMPLELIEKNEGTAVERLTDDCWLALKFYDDRAWLEFAAFYFTASDFDGSNILVECFLKGDGPSDILRECRHTWWGDENGYMFYVNKKNIVAVLNRLSDFFDMN